jgi:hypothetical protein
MLIGSFEKLSSAFVEPNVLLWTKAESSFMMPEQVAVSFHKCGSSNCCLFFQVIREYFNSVLILAEVLLRSSQPIVSQFASVMYQQAFIAFDTFCRQVT